LNSKLKKLKKIISGYGSCLVAFSGGVDSTFLLKVSSAVLPKGRLIAVTANSPTFPKEELQCAKAIAKRLGVRHKIIATQELKNKRFVSNPVNRCYFCKKELFAKLKSIAKKLKLNFVVDASNFSDKRDFRAGNIAKKELKIRSPLCEAGLTKEEIRKLSKKLSLGTWNKPGLACLASRIPYGVRISQQLLERIHRAELHLKSLGIKQVRLRHYNGLCRIEVLERDISKLISKRVEVVGKLKRLGYNYVTVDLQGYRTGSLNEVIKP
jgi:uncharacterized protein